MNSARTSGLALRAAAGGLALAGIAVAVRVMLASDASVLSLHILGTHLHVADPSRPLWLAAALSAALLVSSRAAAARAASITMLSACGTLALIALVRHAPATPPVGDIGVIESYIFDALHGRLFLGPYSRFQWHHPGPMFFFLLAPFYVLSGYRTAGVAVGALAINLASIGFTGWAARRAAGPRTAAVITGACVIYAARFPRLLTSQWNPHVLIFPTLAFVVAAAAVAAGDVDLIPALFVLASFAVQTHLGLAPTVAVVGACALAAQIVGPWRLRSVEERRRFWWRSNAGLWVAALLWLLPIVEEVTGAPGNLTLLWSFFAHGGAGQPLGLAFSAWSGALSGVVRGGFGLAWGGVVLQDRSLIPPATSCAVLALAGACGVRAARAGQRFAAALSFLLVAAALVAFWSVTHIAGDIVDHEVFWMSGLGVLTLAAIVDAALGAPLLDRVRPGLRQWRVADALCGVLAAAVIWLGVSDLRLRIDEMTRPGTDEAAAATLSDEIIEYARKEHAKICIEIDGPAWGVAAAVIVELERADVPFAVGQGAVWMFGPASAPDGTETRTVYISGYGGHGDLVGKPGTITLAERRGFFADVSRRP